MAGQGQGAAAQVDRHRKAQTQSRREAQDVLNEAACEARAWLDARYQGPIGLMSYIPSALNRRRFVEHLFRSPLVLAGTIAAQSPTSPPIESSGDALDVFDFAPSA